MQQRGYCGHLVPHPALHSQPVQQIFITNSLHTLGVLQTILRGQLRQLPQEQQSQSRGSAFQKTTKKRGKNKHKRTIICIQKYLTFQPSECVAVPQPGEKLFENFTSGSVDTCQAPGSGADLLS